MKFEDSQFKNYIFMNILMYQPPNILKMSIFRNLFILRLQICSTIGTSIFLLYIILNI